jgi:hypothetical protein
MLIFGVEAETCGSYAEPDFRAARGVQAQARGAAARTNPLCRSLST